MDDHTVVATELTTTADGSYGSEFSWVTTDGKTWTKLKGWPTDYRSHVATDRDRGVMCDFTGADDSEAGGVFTVFDDKVAYVALRQTGAVPWIQSWQTALGPTGLLVTEDGSRFWIGVPTAG
jgi:hypothetical protein